jgi:hypothetical protein
LALGADWIYTKFKFFVRGYTASTSQAHPDRVKAGNAAAAEAGTTTPPTTGNAESAGDAETPEQAPAAAPMIWLACVIWLSQCREFAELTSGS